MLRRGSLTVASDKDIIEKARNFQTLLERHPEFDRRTKLSHSTSKTTSGKLLTQVGSTNNLWSGTII